MRVEDLMAEKKKEKAERYTGERDTEVYRLRDAVRETSSLIIKRRRFGDKEHYRESNL